MGDPDVKETPGNVTQSAQSSSPLSISGRYRRQHQLGRRAAREALEPMVDRDESGTGNG
jgi:hypothetical protein